MGNTQKIAITIRKKGRSSPLTPPTKTMVNKEVNKNLLKLIPLYTVSVKKDIKNGDNIISIDHPNKCGQLTDSVKGLYKNNIAPKDFPITRCVVLES